jgi:uncharacterized protein (TIGR04255 family)
MEATLLELLGLPQVPRIEFEDPPLVLALCQIKFTSLLSIASPAFVAAFQRAIEDQYPITDSAEQIEVSLGFGPGDAGVTGQSKKHQWRFTDETDTWVVVLAQDFVSLETRRYESFQNFLERLEHIVRALMVHVKPKFITRLGLRYINEIRPENLPWHAVMKPDFLGLPSSEELAKYTQFALQQMVLRFPGQRGINIHHGYLPNGSTVAPRASETSQEGPFYLLDFDVFRELPSTRTRSISADDICGMIADYNKVIYQLFRWCTTDEYIDSLEVRSENA